jgi:hypothetical protein
MSRAPATLLHSWNQTEPETTPPVTVVHAMDPMARRAGHRILSAFGRQTNWGEDPEGATHPLTLKRM